MLRLYHSIRTLFTLSGVTEVWPKSASIFLETVTINEDEPFKVFVTPTSHCNGLYVNKLDNTFEVIELLSGISNATFDYRIVAKRKNF